MKINNLLITLIIIIFIIWFLIPRPTYTEPKIIEGLLSDSECEHIKKVSKSKLKSSTVSQKRDIDEKVRKSDTAWLGYDDDYVVKKIMDTCLDKIGKPRENCESLQILRYDKGGFYSPHQDAFENEKNNRTDTFLISLSDDYEGGETLFPNLNKTYKLKKGDCLHFKTLDSCGYRPRKALHGGNPVISGEKWICNLWIRQEKFNP